MPPRIFRNALRYTRGVWLTRLVPTALLAAFLQRTAPSWPWYWFEIAVVIAALLTLAAFLDPIWAAKFRVLSVTDEDLTLTTGWLFPDSRVIRRGAISTVQVNEPLAQRLAGVRSVTISARGSEQTITMPALTPAKCDELLRLLSEPQPAVEELLNTDDANDAQAPDHGAITKPAEPETTVIHTATAREVFATALSTGYPLVVLAAVAGMVQEIDEYLPGRLQLAWDSAATWVGVIAVLAVIVAVSVAAKFWAFSIARTPNGELEISYGAVERLQHRLAADQIAAIQLVRTPVDLLLRTARLVVSTTRLDGDGQSSLKFPSISLSTAGEVVNHILGRPAPELLSTRKRWLLLGPLPIVGITSCTGMLLVRFGALYSILGAVAGLLVAAILCRYLTGRVRVLDDETISWSEVGLSHRVVTYQPGRITLLIERRLPGIPISNLALHGWANAKVVHRAPVGRRDVIEAVASVMQTSPLRSSCDPLR